MTHIASLCISFCGRLNVCIWFLLCDTILVMVTGLFYFFLFKIFFNWLIEERVGERHQFVVPLYLCVHWLILVGAWPRIEPPSVLGWCSNQLSHPASASQGYFYEVVKHLSLSVLVPNSYIRRGSCWEDTQQMHGRRLKVKKWATFKCIQSPPDASPLPPSCVLWILKKLHVALPWLFLPVPLCLV